LHSLLHILVQFVKYKFKNNFIFFRFLTSGFMLTTGWGTDVAYEYKDYGKDYDKYPVGCTLTGVLKVQRDDLRSATVIILRLCNYILRMYGVQGDMSCTPLLFSHHTNHPSP
jgi:hypothetical protein